MVAGVARAVRERAPRAVTVEEAGAFATIAEDLLVEAVVAGHAEAAEAATELARVDETVARVAVDRMEEADEDDAVVPALGLPKATREVLAADMGAAGRAVVEAAAPVVPLLTVLRVRAGGLTDGALDGAGVEATLAGIVMTSPPDGRKRTSCALR